jgi:uncharacterized iron-regulated membrane protein
VIARRKLLLTVHLVAGLLAAPVLTVLGLSGAVLVFEGPLDLALNAGLLRAEGRGPALSLSEVDRRLERAHPGYRAVAVEQPGDGLAWAVTLSASDGSPDLRLFVDPHDGRELGSAAQQRGLLGSVHQFHTRLLAGEAGKAVVGWTGVLLVVLALSGLALWWPGKILRVQWAGSRRRVVFQLHSALGGICWLSLLLFGLSGVVIYWDEPLLALAARVTGAPPPAPFPARAPGCDGAAPLPLDRIVSAAAAAVPGARVTTAFLSQRGAPARVVMKFPEDHTPAGRTNVFLAGCSGEVVEARSSRAASLAYRAIKMWNREIHTGDLWGWPTRLLAFAASLTLPAMAVTGPAIWWSRRARGRGQGGTRRREGAPPAGE